MSKLSNSKEHYLKAIYKLCAKEGSTRITDVAQELGVTKASTCHAVKDLEERGLVYKTSDRRVYLTEEGKNIILPMVKNYELIKKFFVTILGINEQDADVQACALEHVISNDGIHSIKQFFRT